MVSHKLWVWFVGATWSWEQWKLFLERSVSFSSDSIHVYGGVLIQLVSAGILKKQISSWFPWLVVLLGICMNEFIDLWIEQWPDPGMQYGESAKDLLLSMALPTILMLSARFWPQLYGSHGRQGRQDCLNR